MRIFATNEIASGEIEALLRKPTFDQVRLGNKAKAGIKAVFGKELSAVEVVEIIINDVRQNGDEALLKYSASIDGVTMQIDALEVSTSEFETAYRKADIKVVKAIKQATENIRRFHVEQLPKSWFTEREANSILGQKNTPLDKVGIYVPGGTASYPSSVLMNAIPASVAGVKDIIMVVPPTKSGNIDPHVLVAAKEAGVSRIFKLGGAQAIAALAFGTDTVPKVDKITGPGNIFVTLAKKAVYGYCDIDMLAGPSEILIVADKTANPAYIAADLLSQAEHDTLASGILITDDSVLVDMVKSEIAIQMERLPRKEIVAEALANNGLIIITETIDEAIYLANLAAPEHLEILTADPFGLLPAVRHAGAIFLGQWSPEPLGDYMAGPNHVLPTGGTARFYSVLNTETFMKKTSIIAYTKPALLAVADGIIDFAEAEGLQAHANAIKIRRDM